MHALFGTTSLRLSLYENPKLTEAWSCERAQQALLSTNIIFMPVVTHWLETTIEAVSEAIFTMNRLRSSPKWLSTVCTDRRIYNSSQCTVEFYRVRRIPEDLTIHFYAAHFNYKNTVQVFRCHSSIQFQHTCNYKYNRSVFQFSRVWLLVFFLNGSRGDRPLAPCNRHRWFWSERKCTLQRELQI
jgi:hypothetical protein